MHLSPLAACLLLLVSWTSAQDYNAVSNVGTEFYLMFMPNIVEEETVAEDDQMAFIISNADFTFSSAYEIRMPKMNNSFRLTGTVTPRQSREILLPKEAMHRESGWGNFGIYITASRPVTVIGVNRQRYSVDSYLALPKNNLGVGYIGASYTANIRSQLGIVATLDGTIMRITLPKRTTNPDYAVTIEHNGIFYSNAAGAGDRFDIRLDAHCTFLLTSKGDLTATQIRSNKRISVFGGNVRAKIDYRSRDHLVEQLLPVYSWQNEWFTVPTPHRPEHDTYRILSNTAANIISIQLEDGTNLPQAQVPTASEFAQIEMPAGTPQLAKFTCSEKCMVYQVSSSVPFKGLLGDPSMFTASNPRAFGAYKYIVKTPMTSQGRPFDNNTLVIMSTAPVSPVYFYTSGSSSSSINWNHAPQLGVYYAHLQLPQLASGDPVILRTNSGNDPFVLWLHGMSDRESYAHPLGFNIQSPECLGTDRSLVTPGDGVDNDCDSLVDEEIADGLDDDGDGQIDEDTQMFEIKTSSGREYMIMFMENKVDFPVNPPLELFLGGLETDGLLPTNVTISYPTPTGARESINMHVFPKEVHKVELNHTIMQKGNTLQYKAVHIKADANLVVYGINKEQFSADGFLALPVSTFGTSYYTVSYFPATTGTEFALVAPEDNTVVTLKFPPLSHTGEEISITYANVRYTNNDTLQTTMNAMQTLQIQDLRGDLSGTFISSTKPVGVFSGNIRTFVTYNNQTTVGSRDHLVEQLPPLSSFGTKFAMMTTPDRSVGDFFKIVASRDDTVVQVCAKNYTSPTPSCRPLYINTAGCHERVSDFTSDQTYSLESNYPVLVVQVTRSQENRAEYADPAMMLIPPIEQYSKDYTFLTPTISNPLERQDYLFHNLMVIIDKSKTTGLRIDNNATSFSGVEWHDIPSGTLNLVACSVKLPFALHTLRHTDPSVVYMGLLYGVADRESYGFPIALKLDDIVICSPSYNVEGDGLDNDCDGAKDEETCGNDIDDDGDGRLDEDCAITPTAHTYLAVFMQNTVEEPVTNYPLRLYGASPTSQYVRVSTPYYRFNANASTYDRTMRIDADEILNFGLRPDIRHRGSGISSRGVVVKSQFLLDMFGSNEEKFSHDCFLMLPAELLGREYYTVHYSPSYLQQEFAITPLEDDTSVTVTLSTQLPGLLSFEGATYTAGESITFKLNIGQSAQIQMATLPSSGLTGSRIVSNKPVAVFSGNVRTMVDTPTQPLNSRDHLVEQLLPYDLWQNEYYVPTSPLRNGDVRDVFLFVTKFQSTLTVSDETGLYLTQTLNAREQNLISLPSGDDRHYRFGANNPFQVVRVTWSWRKPEPVRTDPAMLLLIPSGLWKSRYSFALPVSTGQDVGGDYTNVIQLVIQTSKTNGVQIDGKAVEGTWSQMANSAFSTINVSKGHEERVVVSHTENVSFMCYLYGAADRESYAMPCGVSANLG